MVISMGYKHEKPQEIKEFIKVQEREIKTKAHDGKVIYSVFNPAIGAKSDVLVIIGHGLTGHPNEYLHKVSHRYFNEKGWDTLRVAFYCSFADARKLKDCTLAIHASDLNTVIAAYKGQYKKIFAVGHSYGGLTMLFANPDVDAMSFWDSSFTPYEAFWKSDATYIPELDCYKIGWGVDSIIGKAMYEEAKNLTEDVAVSMAKNITIPSQVVLATVGQENPDPEILYKSLISEKELCKIDSNHCFYIENTADILAQKTYEWFAKQGV